jgi:hypothetical protein
MTSTPPTALKVFELRWNQQGDKEWIAARTNIDAIQTYLSITDMSIHELDNDDEIVEIPKEKWPEYTIRNADYDPTDPEDAETETFDKIMSRLTKPDIIGGTMYEG